MKKKKKSSRSIRRHEDKQTSEFRSIKDLRDEIFNLFKRHRRKTGDMLTVAKIRRKLRITNYMFYKAVPGGIREICEVLRYPLPRDRLKAVEKATVARQERKAVADVSHEIPFEGIDESIVDDPGVRQVLLDVREMKRRHDKAELLIKAREFMKELKPKVLEMEAELDPSKTPSYMEEVFWGTSLLEDFKSHCKKRKISMEEGWTQADRAWNCGGPFNDRVRDKVEQWLFRCKQAEGLEKHSGQTWTLTCPKCGTPYEYEEAYLHECFDDDTNDVPWPAKFKCPNNCESDSVDFRCPVCSEIWSSEDALRLFYDPEKNVLGCIMCDLEIKVKGGPLEPSDTSRSTDR